MKLEIISPEKIVYSGEAELVMLPGLKGLFTILDKHAPIISGLDSGTLVYRCNGKDALLDIEGGFVEAKNDLVTVCVE